MRGGGAALLIVAALLVGLFVGSAVQESKDDSKPAVTCAIVDGKLTAYVFTVDSHGEASADFWSTEDC